MTDALTASVHTVLLLLLAAVRADMETVSQVNRLISSKKHNIYSNVC